MQPNWPYAHELLAPLLLLFLPESRFSSFLVGVIMQDKKELWGIVLAAGEGSRARGFLSALCGGRGIKQFCSVLGERSLLQMTLDRVQSLIPRERIVIIVDELADLMMSVGRDIEEYITRLAQKARAAGIHLILATQRPSVDVITGLIKANFPARISFQVTSRIDSRTILDSMGSEKLLGNGDLLYLPPGTARLTRVHGAFVSDQEVRRVMKFIKQQGRPQYRADVLQAKREVEAAAAAEEEYDEMYDQALAMVTETQQASISMVQRRLRVGYNRAARMIEQMERDGVVGPADGAKPREVYARRIED
jgi:DNA segregation ATPase FtsK/SpoIIIE-like protein